MAEQVVQPDLGLDVFGIPRVRYESVLLDLSLAVLFIPRKVKMRQEKVSRKMNQICIKYQRRTCALERLVPKAR